MNLVIACVLLLVVMYICEQRRKNLSVMKEVKRGNILEIFK